MTTLSESYVRSRKYPLRVNSIQRCLTNHFQQMVRSAPSNKIEREDLTSLSMVFLITLGSGVRKMSLWKRWDCRQAEDKIVGWNYKTHPLVVIICLIWAYYYDFFVILQLVRGNSIQDIWEKEEALCLSCTWKRRKFSIRIQGWHSGSHAIAWATITTSEYAIWKFPTFPNTWWA